MNIYKLSIMAALCIAASLPSVAQSKSDKKSKKESPQTEASKKEDDSKKDDIKSIEEITKKCEKFYGLFTMYRDTVNGKLFMQITNDQLGKEYIHFSQAIDGPSDLYAIRGVYNQEKIVRIEKSFDRIEIIRENTSYYFDPSNALSKAKDANINKPVIFREKIVGISKNKDQFLIEAEKLFISEAFEQVKPSPNPEEKPGKSFKVGTLSKDKSKVLKVINYPQNTDVQIQLVYEEQYPLHQGDIDITDARFVSLQIYNSLIAVPENDYRPRFDDPRIGYFTNQITNQTSAHPAPYRDHIHRWHLKKKDPNAAVSEPVEPIVWWIENTTPVELRPYIRDGVLEWNKAFEKAGFRNAVVVKEQPDDATWDAGDLRYNVIRWTSSPRPRFGGLGPSFVNPRTGQILGADIMLEYVFVTNRLLQSELFETAGAHSLEAPEHSDPFKCTLGMYLHNSMLAGKQMIQTMDRDKAEEQKLLQQGIYYLVLHEVGHTLGLNHNMKASSMLEPSSIHDVKLATESGLMGSVMDYPSVNVSSDPQKQGLYYVIAPGPYDDWAIEYGYRELKPDEEENVLSKILSRSTEHALLFGNDADDMRYPGYGIDPRVMIGDMTSDPVAYSVDRIKLVNEALPKLKDKFAKPGESYQGLRDAYLLLTGEVWNSLRVICRQIGGVYVDRSMVGQPGAGKPYEPVSYEQQKKAMNMLALYGFSPDALRFPNDLYNMLQPQRRGFNHYSITEDPKLHERTLYMHRDVLNQLLHKTTMQRIVDSELYGNKYKLSEFMTDLTDAVFREDLNKAVIGVRQNLQTEYTQRLIQVINTVSGYNHIAKAQSFYELKRIKTMISKTVSADASTKAHREYIIYLIDDALDTRG